MPSYPTLVRGTTAWLYDAISAQLPTINAELTAAVKASVPAQPFALVVGEPKNVSGNTIAVCDAGFSRRRDGQGAYSFLIRKRVRVFIPRVGDNTAANFDTARGVAEDNLLALLTDERVSLTPRVAGGPLGNVTAEYADFTDAVDIYPFRMADGVTLVDGFEIPWLAAFSIFSTH